MGSIFYGSQRSASASVIMDMFFIRKDNTEDFSHRLIMAHDLWPDYTILELEKAFYEIMESERQEIILAKSNDEYIAFADISIRYEYVE